MLIAIKNKEKIDWNVLKMRKETVKAKTKQCRTVRAIITQRPEGTAATCAHIIYFLFRPILLKSGLLAPTKTTNIKDGQQHQ